GHPHRCAPARVAGSAGLALAASARCDCECCHYPERITCLDHVRSPLFLFGKEPAAEDCLEPGEGQARRVPRLDKAGFRVVEIGLRLEQIEDSGGASPVTTLLDAVGFACHRHGLCGDARGGARRRIAVVRRGYVPPHRAFGGIARCPEDIPGHARLADQILPLEVVPDRKGNRQRELREVRSGRRVELLVETYTRGRQAGARTVITQPLTGYRL